MHTKIWLIYFLIIFSCYPKPKLEIIKDEFDDSVSYLLDNNILQSLNNTHEIELNIKRKIGQNDSILYLIVLECIGASEIGMNDSTYVMFDIDNIKHRFKPFLAENKIKIDPELTYEVINIVSDYKFIKRVAYSNKVTIKINGSRNIIFTKLSLKNKINLQNFIETFIPLKEQIQSNY